ncbi:MAG: hypothetical protein ABW004_09720, partial [Aeromicrobium sp.]
MWTRPDAHTIDPARTALVVFDMLECYRDEIAGSGALPHAERLVRLARAHGVLVCFARADHRRDGADFTRVVADVDRWDEPWNDARPQTTAPQSGVDYGSLAELGQG